jgi:hypothetical protein
MDTPSIEIVIQLSKPVSVVVVVDFVTTPFTLTYA